MVKSSRKASGAGVVRALNLPAPVEVEEDGRRRPLSIVLSRRRLEVASVDDVWEISDEWWRADPITRRYYRCVMEDGAVIIVFRDLMRGGWFHQKT